MSWLDEYRPSADNPWDRSAVVHLLRRTALGHPPALVEACLSAGPKASVASLLKGQEPDARERSVLARQKLAVASDSGDNLAAWWWARLLMTRHPLEARLGLFWHDHFATSIQKVQSTHWMAQQLKAFDEHGLGDFRTLLLTISKGPAMLRWLDNEQNRKGQANENFSRELFELFTLGRDHYSEDDIKEAARAFTGWRIRRETFFFDRRRHDRGEKTVFGKRGKFGGEEIVDLCLAKRDCARFLSHKLLACFVGPRYREAARDELADRFVRERGDIGKVLVVLLASKLFFDPRQRGARIRGPVEWFVWFLRTLDCTAAPSRLHKAAERMGQSLLSPPDVSGWDEEEAWVSSAAWLHRANAAGMIGREGSPAYMDPPLDAVVPRGAANEASWLLERLFPEGVTDAEREQVERQARAEARLPRDVRLAGLLRTCLMLPRAHRF